MARGSSLSDNNVINELNRDFIAIDDNITLQGWPDMPALAPWKRWFDKHSDSDGVHRNGFTTSVIVTPDGKMALGTSGSGYVSELQTSVCYRPDKYYDFLRTTRQRYDRLKQIQALPQPQRGLQVAQMQMEIMQETASRSHGK